MKANNGRGEPFTPTTSTWKVRAPVTFATYAILSESIAQVGHGGTIELI